MLNKMNSIDEYRQHFMDVEVWRPHVRETYRRHFGEAGEIRPGLVGTYPTFIVNDRHVVKFFGRLFDGAAACETEREAYRVVHQAPGIPIAELEAQGELIPGDPGWPWPYLIYEYLPGESFGEAYDRLDEACRAEFARQMGRIVKALHGLPLTGRSAFGDRLDGYANLIRSQAVTCTPRLRQWASLPPDLIAQVDSYLLPVEDLIDFSARPHLIHADLTGDHLLGFAVGRRWSTSGLIDWGDAMTGNILYELVALHLDMFRGDPVMLAAFLDTYQLPPSYRQDFARKAMCLTLLHRFDVLAPWSGRIHAGSLDELAGRLWGIASKQE